MKFKKSTQILFASALILATGVAVYEGTIAPERQAAKLQQQQVFDFEIDRVVALMLETPDRTLQFDRILADEENSTEPRWEFKVVEASEKSEIQKTPILAKEAYVSFLLDAIVNAKSDRTFTVAESELAEYGLDAPQATIDVKLDDDTTHQIQLGKRDFSESLVYAIANPLKDTDADLSVLLVSTNLENGVNRSLSEWQADEEEPEETEAAESKPQSSETKPAETSSEGEETQELDSQPDSSETEPISTDTEEIESVEESEETPDSESTESSSEAEQTPNSGKDLETPIAPKNPETSTETPEKETTEPTPPPEEVENAAPPSETSKDSNAKEEGE